MAGFGVRAGRSRSRSPHGFDALQHALPEGVDTADHSYQLMTTTIQKEFHHLWAFDTASEKEVKDAFDPEEGGNEHQG